jgi:hypothetical protein
MANTISFKKENKGISVTVNSTKTSYSANVKFRGFNTGTNIAHIDISPYSKQPISELKIDTSEDTITVNSVAFSGNATGLIDSLRDTVFIADAVV